MKSVVVAFSGGIDSTLVAKTAVSILGYENTLAVTADSSSMSRDELAEAKALAQSLKINHKIVLKSLKRSEYETKYFIIYILYNIFNLRKTKLLW